MPSMEQVQFIKGFHEKMMTLENVNAWLRQGSEFEVLTEYNAEQLRVRLNNQGVGCSNDKGMNNGNGWNDDCHQDGYDFTNSSFVQFVDGVAFYGTEVSTSPLNGINYAQMKDEYEKLFALYLKASGKVLHNIGGSCHMHTAEAYAYVNHDHETGRQREVVVKLPVNKMYRAIATFMVRFMPVLKWLSMTNIKGSRATALGSNRYDRLCDDYLFDWADMVVRDGHNQATDSYLKDMERNSYLRIHQSDCLHWENRILDCNLSPTLMSAWGALNRAITLFAYDMARNDFEFPLTSQMRFNSKEAMTFHLQGYKYIRKEYLQESYNEMMSYLYKYFKKASSLGAIEIFNKLFEKPFPAFLEEKGIRTKAFSISLLDDIWGGRNRAKDESLRGSYLRAIRSMSIPISEKLMGENDSFNANVAKFLNIQYKQAVSLYQMYRREFEEGKTLVNLEFNCYRLMDMSE